MIEQAQGFMRGYAKGRATRRLRSAAPAWLDGLFVASVPAQATHRIARLISIDGCETEFDVNRWHGDCTVEDHDALSRALSPVLDIGCGPGRHVRALVEQGQDAFGIDISAEAVRAAHRRGAPAIVASVWGPVPRTGYWQTALLLDGNVGIGGDPAALLRRTVELLDGARRVIVELLDSPIASGRHLVRVEHDGQIGRWFPWAVVTPESIGEVAEDSGLTVEEIWRSSTRWFAVLSSASGGHGQAAEMQGSAA